MAIKREIKREPASASLQNGDASQAGVKAKTREAEIQGDEDEVEEFPIRWKLLSGSLTLADGRHFEAGATFEAYEREISKAFRDAVVPADPVEQIKERKAPVKFHIVPVEGTDEEKAKEDYEPVFNVANASGVAINPTPLNEKDANKLLSILNG